jgi:NAD(P)-dependent dehydrogenase (short-subunit alcohol dehydrogenase family)
MSAGAPSPLSVLVTGATGSAGRAVSRRFAADGARVAVNGSNRDRLDALIAELGFPDGRVVPVEGDLLDAAAAGEVVTAAEAALGRIDVVAHLVGGYAGGTAVVDLDPDEVRSMLDQHLWTTLHVLQAAVPGMVERGFGRIVAITAATAANPGPRAAAYAAAKSAEEALVRTLAREVASSGVTANLLAIRTLDDAKARAEQPNAKTASWTTPDEVADAIAWLASPAAAAVNGQRIALDGRA